MPNLGFGEIIVILLVALLVFGPRRLPEIGRTVGKSLREFRRATSSLKAEFEQDLDVEPPRRAPARRRRPPIANGEASESVPEEEPEPETGGSPD